MAKARTLVPKNGYRIGLLAILILAAFFRLWHLATLPPGLAAGEATVGLAAYNLLHHGIWPSFNLANGGSPVLVGLEAVSIWLFGLAPWVLRLVPALLGITAVGTIYLWSRAWFGRRTALVAAFLLAVTPWSVTISRNVMPAALAPLLLTLLLWLATRLWHKRSLANLSLFAIAVLIASLSGPVGWGALLVTFAAALVVALGRGEKMTPRQVTAWLGLVVIAVLPAVIVASRHKASGRSLIIGTNFAHYLGGVWTTLLAFQIHGDDNYFHNLGGAPLLNVFVGIMLVAGILVSLTRWKKRPERALLVGTVVALIPALMSPQTAPDASRLVLVLPLVLVLAAIGVGYMLEVWYATFPINSAARLTGQLAIILLLALTAYQGYTQYFVAWANSSDTHRAYNDAALGMASWIAHEPAGTTSLVVVNTDDATVLRYKLVTQPSYRVVTPAQLNASLTQRPLYLVVGTADRDQVVAQLKTAAPGGTLQSHQSSFDGADLYYTYDIR